MKQHTVIGGSALCEPPSLQRVRGIVRHHHERCDGSGYPDGLHGNQIPFLAQIIGIVDVFDALTTARPYKPAQSAAHACDDLRREVDRGWRRGDLVDAFIALVHGGRLPRLGVPRTGPMNGPAEKART